VSARLSAAGQRVPRALGVGAMLLAFVAGTLASHGCIDDRKKIAAQVFFCNPDSRTADADCGKGFMCYSAAQALGGSICVPRCDPNNAASCDGACTQSGACLTRCTVPKTATDAEPCPTPLLCTRITDSPIQEGPDGVCLPINNTCSMNRDCTSPVFDECISNVNGAAQGGGLLTSGNACVAGRCSARGIACSPGSACIRDIVPGTVPAPDLCSPICTPVRDRPDGGASFNECMPSLTCLSDAFPQTESPACSPGFPGWLCVDDFGCTAGKCYDWKDLDKRFDGFKTCAPPCKSDDDCVPYDRGGNPSYLTRNICHDGQCRNLQSMFFPLNCMVAGKGNCHLDPEAECVFPSSDMGMVPQMGLGALGGTAAFCVHGCQSASDCDGLATVTHMPMTCGTVNNVPACVPMIPFFIECKTKDDCFGTLTCEQVPAGPSGAVVGLCTRRCTTSADCAGEPGLGTTFSCNNNVCVPKTLSGDKATSSDQCLSGVSQNGVCVSPTNWACTDDAQCANQQCDIIPLTDPKFGRCR
jgi:hypothetical protein